MTSEKIPGDDELQQVGAAMSLAARVQECQLDKQGFPCLSHPLRVAADVAARSAGDLVAVTVALLHDVLEDSSLSRADLRFQGFSPAVCAAVEVLTHTEDDSYEEFISGITASGDALAMLVKLCDLADNLDESRGPVPPHLREKYEPASLTLSRALGLEAEEEEGALAEVEEVVALLAPALRLEKALAELGLPADGEYEQVLLRQCALFGNDHDDERVAVLHALYLVFAGSTTPKTRLETLTTLTTLIESGETTADALLPFVYTENDPGVLLQAALTLALLFEPQEGDPLSGPRFVRRLVDESVDDIQSAALLGALLLLGDRRVDSLLSGCWHLLGFRGQQQLTRTWSGFAYASTIDFYLDWLQEAEGEEMGMVAAALARVPLEASPCLVLDLARIFPANAHPGEPAVKVLKEWSFPEYAKLIEPALRRLARKEAVEDDPQNLVMPLVLRAWGL